jgi:hypothetical protein
MPIRRMIRVNGFVRARSVSDGKVAIPVACAPGSDGVDQLAGAMPSRVTRNGTGVMG